jgi:dodecin
MSLVRVVEVSAESPYGYDDAGRQAVKRAARTRPNVSAMWLKEVEPVVRTDAAAPFRVKAQIAYVLGEGSATAEAA